MDRLDNLLNTTGDIALRRRARWLILNMNLRKGDKILDVGCGDGFYLYLLSKLDSSFRLTGVDTNINALNSAEANLKGKKVNLIQADVLKLPFPKATFDKIIASEVLEHVSDDPLALREIYRVLKKGGTFVLSVPHKNYPFFWDPINWILEHLLGIHIESGFWAGIWNQHLRLYTEDNLQTLLRKSFKKITVSKLTHYCLPFNHYIINIVAIILASKKMPNDIHNSLNKFKTSTENKGGFDLFQFIFLLDRLNDSWDGKGAAVSLVAKGVK